MASNQKPAHIDTALLKRFVPLNSLPDKHLKDLAQHSRVLKVQPKTLLFKRKIKAKDKMYLVSGAVDLCDSQFGIRAIVSTPEQPSTHALNPSNPTHSAAITTSTSSILLVDSDRLDLILTWSQAGNYLVEDLQDNIDETNDDWMSDLLQSNLLQKIPPSNIQQLFISFKQENFKKGQMVIQQGDTGESFYVLQQGTAQVYRLDETNTEVNLATLRSGQFFGEEALIGETTRNASIRMLTEGACMKLDKATFNKLLKEPVLNVVSASKVASMQAENPKIRLVDLRTTEEATSEPLDNVLHIPFTDLRQQLASLDKELTYITHTISGRRAELGAYLMSDAGFDALVMK